jgi:hypothetical protein
MCQHVHSELVESTSGLLPNDIQESVDKFCETLDEEIADAVFDICKEFIKTHGKGLAEALVAKKDAPATCKGLGVCTEEMIISIQKAWEEQDLDKGEEGDAHVDVEKDENKGSNTPNKNK